MRKIIKKSTLSVLIFIFVISYSRLALAITIPDEELWSDYEEYIVIDHDTTWSGDVIFDNPDKPVVIVNGATVTIQAGAHISLVKLIVCAGRIIAEGAADNKIVFTTADPDFSDYPDGFSLNCLDRETGIIEFDDASYLYGMEPSLFRYVEFNNMGSYQYHDSSTCPAMLGLGDRLQSFFGNIAQASVEPDVKNPALRVLRGQLHIENSSFSNNSYADIEVDIELYDGDPDSYLEVHNSNFSGNNQDNAVISSVIKNTYDEKWHIVGDPVHKNEQVMLKNNWYGGVGNPKVAPDYILGGEIVSGDYTLDSFRMSRLIADPVIVIPGIMGSSHQYIGVIGKMKLDPVMHTYDNLILSFKKNGYAENENLFEFPYEWRNSNELTALDLKDKIQTVKDKTGASKIDLVAHSMGGLVARQYAESNNYDNDIDQLIMLGTPHHGSPKAYLKWEAGEGFMDALDKLSRQIFKIEAKHAGYDDLGKYIREKVVSVGELLPDYDYLHDVSSGSMRNYPKNYPRNMFLENLNDSSNIEKLKNINFTNIIGNVDSENTMVSYRVVDSDLWVNGMPENFYDETTDRGIDYGKGDETVPVSSIEDIISDKSIEINSSHGDLPMLAQCYVIKELTGDNDCDYVDTIDRIVSILTFGVFSPIDIQIIAPDGKRVGKNFATGEIFDEIEGAYYSGFETENEFLTIPNPSNGQYQILTQGTGEGDFKIETTEISQQSDGSAQESTVALVGTATLDAEKAFIVSVTGETVIDPNAQTKVSDDQNDDSQGIQEEQAPAIEETQVVVADNNQEKKTEKHQEKSSKKEDSQLADVENNNLLVATRDDNHNENSLIANLKDGFDKLNDDIGLAKTAQAEDVIKKNRGAGSGNGKVIFEVFASLVAIFVARKGLLFFLAKI